MWYKNRSAKIPTVSELHPAVNLVKIVPDHYYNAVWIIAVITAIGTGVTDVAIVVGDAADFHTGNQGIGDNDFLKIKIGQVTPVVSAVNIVPVPGNAVIQASFTVAAPYWSAVNSPQRHSIFIVAMILQHSIDRGPMKLYRHHVAPSPIILTGGQGTVNVPVFAMAVDAKIYP